MNKKKIIISVNWSIVSLLSTMIIISKFCVDVYLLWFWAGFWSLVMLQVADKINRLISHHQHFLLEDVLETGQICLTDIRNATFAFCVFVFLNREASNLPGQHFPRTSITSWMKSKTQWLLERNLLSLGPSGD